MPDLSPFLTMNLGGDHVPPSVFRAVHAGWLGGIILAPTSLKALGEVSWLLRDTARQGGHDAPLLYLDPGEGPHSLFPLPSLCSMALSGMADEARLLLTAIGEQIRQFGVDAIIGPFLNIVGDQADGNPWSIQTSRFTQIWVTSFLDAHIRAFIRINGIPPASGTTPVALYAAIDAGLPGIIATGTSAAGARAWADSLHFAGVVMRDLRGPGLTTSDLITALTQGFHAVLLPATFPVGEAYAALQSAWTSMRLVPAHLRATRERVPPLPPPWVPQTMNTAAGHALPHQWSQDIWAGAVIHTGPPLSIPAKAKFAVIEFGSPSPLAPLLGMRLAAFYRLPLHPQPGDLPRALTQGTDLVRVVRLNNARLHPGQLATLKLCRPFPIAVAMDHPEDLLTLPHAITGLTNFDRQANAYQAISLALLGHFPVVHGWPQMPGEFSP